MLELHVTAKELVARNQGFHRELYTGKTTRKTAKLSIVENRTDVRDRANSRVGPGGGP
jgi:hypothetical protein